MPNHNLIQALTVEETRRCEKRQDAEHKEEHPAPVVSVEDPRPRSVPRWLGIPVSSQWTWDNVLSPILGG